jgi:hypothetical protein
MARPLFILIALLVASLPASAATLQGRVVNGTTGETGTADLVAIFDVTQPGDEPLVSLENVTGEFTLEGIPDAAAAHFQLELRVGDLAFRQAIPGFDSTVEAFVYESTDDLSGVALLRHHVIFTRDPEHLQVTEFFEFDNRTNPPRAIVGSALPMRLHFGHDTHGAPTASIWGNAAPVDVPLVPTGTAPVQGVQHALQPGSTRLIVRYLVHEEGLAYRWSSESLFATEERRILVNPMDVEVESEGMIPTDPAIEDYATWSLLASEPGDDWVISLSGGTAVAATGDAHDHDAEQARTASAFTDIVARPNRLTESRVQIMIGLGGLLLFGTLAVLANTRRTAPQGAAPDDDARLAVSKIADQYVSGKISREDYEREAGRLMKKAPAKSRKG